MNAPPFAKHLASTDKKVRDRAIKSLSTFLADDPLESISKPDMDKLWKGIFYCFWMSDKPLVQQALASELAELLLTITSVTSSLSFLRGFWEATVREWNGIDRLRLDKYYMLVRRFVNATFRLLGRAEWDKSACTTYNDILTSEGGPLCPTDIRVPTSLAYHLSDIFIEELEKAMAGSPRAHAPRPALNTPDPILHAGCADADKHHLQACSDGTNACFDRPQGGKIEGAVLQKKLLRRIFEIASEPQTRESSRRKMYALFKESTEDDAGEEG
ncbi:nucleolar protein,Nop52-domain-containing protein [Mycena alexandri]|uniref:Nucleolar protein,Nop52-domain-containing protein n=1 Tax=Mycena alexandri TaxID=1745969 RepID=A0AAD6T6R3_9AGAR|nr:nucleolar protein,Nop52-domain-containing protein [Mycena alexandri]